MQSLPSILDVGMRFCLMLTRWLELYVYVYIYIYIVWTFFLLDLVLSI